MPKNLSCWEFGDNKRLATASATLVHIHSDTYRLDGTLITSNNSAIEAPHAAGYVMRRKILWLRSEPPRKTRIEIHRYALIVGQDRTKTRGIKGEF